MKRLIEKTVLVGLVTAWRLATVPTRRSPDWAKATTDGVVRPPSAFSMTVGSPPSRTAMHEFVVPRSIPIVLPMMGATPDSLLSRKSKRHRSRFVPHRQPRPEGGMGCARYVGVTHATPGGSVIQIGKGGRWGTSGAARIRRTWDVATDRSYDRDAAC